MSTIKDTLSLEDRISSQMNIISRSMENATAEADYALKSIQALEKEQAQWKAVITTATQKNDLNNASVRKASEEITKNEKELYKLNQEYLKSAKAVDKYEKELKDLENQQNRNVKGFESVAGKIVTVSAVFQLVGQAIRMVQQLYSEMEKYIDAYKLQSEAENKLAIITNQRLGLNNKEVQSLYNLASAQQRIGVVGDEVQLSGMANLASFVKQKESIEALTPAMNNLIVKMQGTEATQEGAKTASMLLGRALLGSTDSLKRYGIYISDVQKKWLQTLPEQERAIELSKIITGITGNLNEEMANTPFGKVAQLTNQLGDSYEKLGRAMLPIKIFLLDIANSTVGLIANGLASESMLENLYIILGMVSSGLTYVGIQATWAGIQSMWAGRQAILAGLKTAGAWALANLPLLAIVGTVGLLMVVFLKFNKVIENVMNFCIDRFFNFTNFVISSIRLIAQAIDSVFKTNLTSGIDRIQALSNKAQNMAHQGTHKMQQWLENVGKTDITAKISGGANGVAGALANTDPLAKYSDGKALKTKQQGKMELKDEDVQMLNDLASRNFMLRYQALNPNINFGSVTVNENADFTSMLDQLDTWVADQANNNLNVGNGQ